jgi:hypothetical protein
MMDDAFDAALSALADALGPLYDQQATISRPVRLSDGMGGTLATTTTIAVDVPCIVQPTGFTREEREIGAALAASKLWAVAIPLSAVTNWAILPQDTITVAGRRYEVQNTDAGEGHAIELVATCVRLDPQAAPTPPAASALLLEDGASLLLEDGSALLLETA